MAAASRKYRVQSPLYRGEGQNWESARQAPNAGTSHILTTSYEAKAFLGRFEG